MPANRLDKSSPPKPVFNLGIDLGGTKTEIVVLDETRQQVFRRRVMTPADDYEAIIELISGLVSEARHAVGEQFSVGIGTPGALSPDSGLLRNSNTSCLNNKPLKLDLEKRLNCPVKLQNDANCFTLSEALNGAGQGYVTVFGVILGTGTGGGLVVNGQLLTGPNAIAGEWGHNPLPWPNSNDGLLTCYCGKQGCIETYLSGVGLARNFQSRYGFELSSEQIVDQARGGDSQCAAAIERYYDQLARSLAHVINLIDPDVIVLGGGMSNIEELYQELPDRLRSWVFSDVLCTQILPAEHGDASGVLGAALL